MSQIDPASGFITDPPHVRYEEANGLGGGIRTPDFMLPKHAL